ncbi:MAG: argininosuccinate lyase [Firmicutes bacterium]|nr:argininosuccinate lyase [Bacillota bacterium]
MKGSEQAGQSQAGQSRVEVPRVGRDPVYVDVVLQPGFSFARDRLARFMLEVNVAHVLMLLREAHLERRDGVALLKASGPMMEKRDVPEIYDPAFEDLFFMIEVRAAEMAGADAVGSMHLAMSRNDMDTAIYRMAARERLIELATLLASLRGSLITLARDEIDTIMPAYTHHQQAQPTTLGHYLAAVEAALGRDSERLDGAWRRTNLSPLGAAALAGTGFRVDRGYEAGLLGFEGLVENTYDAVSSADYLAEIASCCAVLATDLSRFLSDLLFWTANEVAALKLDPSFIQVSSIMPQKRNPVALEHLRALVGKALGEAQSAYLLLHNIPFGDVNDAGEQLQPVVHGQCDLMGRALRLLDRVVRGVSVDRELLKQRVKDGFSMSTELADTLVRKDGLKFRAAHQVVSALVNRLNAEGRPWGRLNLKELNAVMREKTGRDSGLSAADLAKALSPEEFISRRKNAGAPAGEQLGPYLAGRASSLRETEKLWAGRQNLLDAYRARLSAEWRSAAGAPQDQNL